MQRPHGRTVTCEKPLDNFVGVREHTCARVCSTGVGGGLGEKTLLVINPAFASEESKFPGEVLSETIARVSGGGLIKLVRTDDRRHVPPSSKEMDSIIKGIEKSFV